MIFFAKNNQKKSKKILTIVNDAERI